MAICGNCMSKLEIEYDYNKKATSVECEKCGSRLKKREAENVLFRKRSMDK